MTGGARRGVLGALSGLLGIGLCLWSSSASAGDATQALSPQAAAQGLGPQRAASATYYAANPAKRRMIIAGASTLGGFWTASAIHASLIALEKPGARRVHCSQVACFAAPRRGARPSSPALLLVPLAGPWIRLGTTQPSAAGAVKLSVLGVGQAVGLGMLLGGIAMPSHVHVPIQRGRVLQVGAAPIVGPDGLGISIHGAL